MKIVLSGGWSYGNIGDEAIARCTMYLLKNFFPRFELTIFSYNPQNFYYHHKIKSLESVHKKVDQCGLDSLSRMKDVLREPKAFMMDEFSESLDENTLFVMAGGGYFNDRWNRQFMARILEIEIAKSRKAKIALIGQSIGPVTNAVNRRYFKTAINSCDYINVRDKDTYNLIREFLPDKDVTLGIDTAIIISDTYISGKKIKKPVINVMAAGYSKYTAIQGDFIQNRFFNKLLGRITLKYYIYGFKMKKIMKLLGLQQKFKIRFVMSTNWYFDLNFTKKIAKSLPDEGYEIIVNPRVSELCRYLSEGQVMISSKMHPVIISAAYNIESIAISYNYKIDNFMDSIDCQDNCYRNDRISIESIVNKIPLICGHENMELEQKVKEWKKSVYTMAEQMAEMFGKSG